LDSEFLARSSGNGDAVWFGPLRFRQRVPDLPTRRPGSCAVVQAHAAHTGRPAIKSSMIGRSLMASLGMFIREKLQ